jgi:cyclopropane fatty-acyl-phospholipid synthase-like methyltransferase
VEVVEGSGRLSPGRALDIGCGTGTNSIYLASHGWTVVGIDFTAKALARAARKAANAASAVSFLHGDVTRLESLHLKPGFDLLLDIGCFHSVPPHRRAEYAQGVALLANSGAVFLLFSFRTRSGVTDDQLRSTFEPRFAVLEVRPGRGAYDPAWYRLQRRDVV